MHQDEVNTLRSEYDFSHGARGKHHQSYRRSTNAASAAACANEARNPSVTPTKGRQPVTWGTLYDPTDLGDS